MKTIAEYAAPTSPFIIKVAVEKGAQELKGRKHMTFRRLEVLRTSCHCIGFLI